MNQYPPEHAVRVVNAVAGRARVPTLELALHALDRGEHFDHLTSLYVPAIPRLGGWGGASFEELQETLARLRAPDGCPWDQKQTHASLRESLLEEACEVLDAIDADDPQALKELPAGSFYTEPPSDPHFAETRDTPVILQITGYGPTGTTY